MERSAFKGTVQTYVPGEKEMENINCNFYSDSSNIIAPKILFQMKNSTIWIQFMSLAKQHPLS